jgi:hypothetical protein
VRVLQSNRHQRLQCVALNGLMHTLKKAQCVHHTNSVNVTTDLPCAVLPGVLLLLLPLLPPCCSEGSLLRVGDAAVLFARQFDCVTLSDCSSPDAHTPSPPISTTHIVLRNMSTISKSVCRASWCTLSRAKR